MYLTFYSTIVYRNYELSHKSKIDIILVQGGIISGPERELLSHVGIGKQIKFWSTIFLSEWTLGSSSKFVVDQNLGFQQFEGVTASFYHYTWSVCQWKFTDIYFNSIYMPISNTFLKTKLVNEKMFIRHINSNEPKGWIWRNDFS